MKALSVRQPWASLIVLGLKSVEIRSWATSFRGPLLIHAAQTLDERALQRFRMLNPPTGCLLGVVDLTGVEPFTRDSWRALADEHLDIGPFPRETFAWHLARPRLFAEPLPYRGDRGLFDVAAGEKLLAQAEGGRGE